MFVTNWLSNIRQRIFSGRRKSHRRNVIPTAASYSELLETRTLLTVSVLGSSRHDPGGAASGAFDISNVTVPAGDDLAIVVVAAGDPDVNSFTFNGQALTEVANREAANFNTSIWVAPLGDSASDITATLESIWNSTAPTKNVAVLAVSGVDQSTPTDSGSITTNTTNATTSSIDVSSEVGDLVVDSVITFFGNSPPTVSVPQTSVEARATSPSFGMQIGASYLPGVPITTMSWSGLQNELPVNLTHLGISVNQVPVPKDFGDAPDTGAGTGAGNYETTNADGGPSHSINANLHLGATVDGDSGTLQNAAANADDVDAATPDDEDGVVYPLADLKGTIGAAPTITLLATNNTGSAATLYGWIDYNQDGSFDNATERANVAVADGTTDGRLTLTFPTIPEGTEGKTYARFRLSTDAAAANSTGTATDGEVEDYAFTITDGANPSISSVVSINSASANAPTLADGGNFGISVASIGDLDGDGVGDLASGSVGDDAGGADRGALHLLFMNADGSIKSTAKVDSTTANGPTLANGDRFGRSVASIGDLNGDGVTDLAVGAYQDDTGGSNYGAVHVLFMNSDGSVASTAKIDNSTTNGPTLGLNDFFGTSVAGIGDLDGDGLPDLAIGAPYHSTSPPLVHGAAFVLLLNSDGSVKSTTKINQDTANGPTLQNADRFGSSLASLGDLDGDGVVDLAVGAEGDDGLSSSRGAVHVVFLNSDGTVKSTNEIDDRATNGPTLLNGDSFGRSLASIGDTNADGVTDLVVGANGDDTGGDKRGAFYVLLMNADGSVQATSKFDNSTANGPTLADKDQLGFSVASLGDLNGDDVPDLVSGATGDDTGASNRGALHLFFLDRLTLPDFGDAPDTGAGTGAGNYQTAASDDGPAHTVLSTIFLGANVDEDNGTLQNAAANADDVDGALPNDEDGVPYPQVDLRGTVDAIPTITLLATNNTGSAATLSGWIDYNADGVFDNATERAQIAVPDGSNNVSFALTFPVVPAGSEGDTYARFRLSTDAAAENSTGAATDGEVEDYQFTIIAPSLGAIISTAKIESGTANAPTLANGDYFGASVTSIGDLDGDGVTDLAVGASSDDAGGSDRGALHVLFMNADGSIKGATKIDGTTANGPALADSDRFGSSVAAVGDLDADGVLDLAVGAFGDNASAGAVHILYMNTDGSLKATAKIDANSPNGPTLAANDAFGESVAAIGDLNGDGVADLVAGSSYQDGYGSVHVLFLNSDGTLQGTATINAGTANGPTLAAGNYFGKSVTSLGDLDGDGIADLAIGAPGDSTGGYFPGAVHVLLMNEDGSVKSSSKIDRTTANGPALSDYDFFGVSAVGVGDIDGDGVPDLIAGAPGDAAGGAPTYMSGAVHVLLLNADGSVKATTKINRNSVNGPTVGDYDQFGSAVASLGDLDGDGLPDLAVGARYDSTGGTSRGGVHILFLKSANADPTVTVGDLSYTEDQDAGAPVVIDSTATANDDDGDADWDGGSLTVQITANNEAGDELSIAAVGGITVSGANVQTGGATTFAMITETSGTADDGIVTDGDVLTLTFNSNAANALVQSLVQAIAYRTTSDTPGVSDRTVTLTVTDGPGASASDTSTISVTSNADEPTVTAPASAIVINTGNFSIEGTSEANALVQVYSDGGTRGVIDGSDAVVSSQQLTGGATSFAISTALAQDADNNFLVTVTDANSDESGPVTVPTLTEDSTTPTVSISAAQGDPTNADPINVTVTFSEDVTGFVIGDVTVGNGSASNFAGTGATYTFDVSPTADGDVTVDVAGAVAQDAATNDNTAATQFTIESDQTAPTVSIAASQADPTNADPINVTVTFSEDVTGFVIGDVTVGNGSASNFAGSGASYTFDVSPTADGDVTIDVAGAVAQDAATNDNTAATQFTIESDQTAPTVSISASQADPTNADPINVTVTFSEDMTGFAIGDVTVANGSASNFAGSGASYTFAVSPTADGDVTIDVAGAVAQDAATNDNTAATQFTIESDQTSPTVSIAAAQAAPRTPTRSTSPSART